MSDLLALIILTVAKATIVGVLLAWIVWSLQACVRGCRRWVRHRAVRREFIEDLQEPGGGFWL